MATELGVNEHHKNVAINYLRFARYQRAQRLRAVDACFKELEDSRLSIDDTFTKDEVAEMLEGLLAVVRGEVETELINTSHTNVLLLRQFFMEAENWHLKLVADISELENRELLEQIADFEEREFSGAKRDNEFNPANLKLQPLNETGGSALLHMEITRLQDENANLRSVLEKIEKQALDLSKDKGKLAADLEKMKSAHGIKSDDEALESLRQQLDKYKSDGKSDNDGHVDNMGDDLTNLKHEMLRVKAMLDLKEEQLNKKVRETQPYQNLLRMQQQKNEQLKVLRQKLVKYEGSDD